MKLAHYPSSLLACARRFSAAGLWLLVTTLLSNCTGALMTKSRNPVDHRFAADQRNTVYQGSGSGAASGGSVAGAGLSRQLRSVRGIVGISAGAIIGGAIGESPFAKRVQFTFDGPELELLSVGEVAKQWSEAQQTTIDGKVKKLGLLRLSSEESKQFRQLLKESAFIGKPVQSMDASTVFGLIYGPGGINGVLARCNWPNALVKESDKDSEQSKPRPLPSTACRVMDKVMNLIYPTILQRAKHLPELST